MNQKEKLIARYNDLRQQIKNATSIVPDESRAQKADRIHRARQDYGYFVEYYFPHYAKSKCAWFHLRAANALLLNKRFKGLMEWARGLAKSTHFNVLIPMWLMIQDEKEINMAVIVGKTKDDAIKQISDLQAELEANARFIHDFGEQMSFGNWEEGDFTTKQGVNVVALGRGQSPRGLRNKSQRVDYIVCDDLDDDELVLNEYRVDKVVDWIKGALIGTMDIGIARFTLVNNRIHKRSILGVFIEENEVSRAYYHLKVNALDDNGRPQWPEKYTAAYFEEQEEIMGSIAYQREYMNNPIEAGKIFKSEYFQYKDISELSKYRDLVVYTDPGFMDSKTSDFKATVLIGVPKENPLEIHVIDCFLDKASITKMIDWHYLLYQKYSSYAVRWFMEDVFLQKLLFKDFNAEALIRQIFIPIVGDKRQKPDKDSRITALSPFFERGFIFFNAKKKNDHHMARLISHLKMFQPGKKTPKDGPDALEGAVYIIQKSINMTRFKPKMGTRRPRSRW